MKIGRKVKTSEIKNPFRPNFGVPRTYSLCRITMDSGLPVGEETKLSMQVDADDNKGFEMDLRKVVQFYEHYRDNIYEMWFIHPKHKETVIEIAKKHFDEVIYVENGFKTTLKGR